MVKKQKIFIEATPLTNTHLSGVGQVVLETIRAFDNDVYRDEYDIRAFVPFDEKEKMSKYTFRNIKIVSLPFPHKFLSLFARLPVAVPLDLVLGRGLYIFPNFRNWNLAFSRSVTYIHDVCFAIYPEYVQPRNLNFLKKYINMWIGRTNRIITVSHTSKKEVNEYLNVPTDTIDVIENTIDTTFYSPQDAKEVARVKQLYDLDNYLLFIGNIEPRKNLTTLIDAFEKAEIKKPTTLFIVGGDGWLNDKIYKKIDHAVSLGLDVRKNASYIPDEDLPGLLTGANALILPSWHEGFGLPALQAVACGTKAICADIPALRELSGKYETVFDFFDPSNSEALAQLLYTYADKKVLTKPANITRTWRDATDELLVVSQRMKRSHS